MPAVIPPVMGVSPTTATGYASKAEMPSTDGSQFASTLTGALDNVQSLQATSNELAIKAASESRGDRMSWTVPSSAIVPASAVSAPLRHLMSVDFPAPLAPSRARTSP